MLVLFGGRSAEHDVSRATAVSVAQALDPQKYEIVPVAITTDGRWLLADEAVAQLEGGPDALPAAFAASGSPVELPSDPARAQLMRLEAGSPLAVDVVLPLLHGPYGEDGTVQGLLELAGLPYVGAGVLGSAVVMDKIMMKRAFAAAGLPYAPYLVMRDTHDAGRFADRVEAEIGLPCFVKPSNMGSSIGVSKVRTRAELDAAIVHALDYDEWILAEEAVAGREIEVAVLGDDPPEASVPGEVIPAADFYDYADKYEDGKAQLLVPAPLSEAETREVRGLAVRAFEACRCEAMARVDCFLRTDGAFLLNELNTIPGFTPISMYPKLWAATRTQLSGAHRPPDRPGHGAPRPPRSPRRPPALTPCCVCGPHVVWVWDATMGRPGLAGARQMSAEQPGGEPRAGVQLVVGDRDTKPPEIGEPEPATAVAHVPVPTAVELVRIELAVDLRFGPRKVEEGPPGRRQFDTVLRNGLGEPGGSEQL